MSDELRCPVCNGLLEKCDCGNYYEDDGCDGYRCIGKCKGNWYSLSELLNNWQTRTLTAEALNVKLAEEVKRLKDVFTAKKDLSDFFLSRPCMSNDEIEVNRLITSAEQMRKERL
jgi:hypothetical protein